MKPLQATTIVLYLVAASFLFIARNGASTEFRWVIGGLCVASIITSGIVLKDKFGRKDY